MSNIRKEATWFSLWQARSSYFEDLTNLKIPDKYAPLPFPHPSLSAQWRK